LRGGASGRIIPSSRPNRIKEQGMASALVVYRSHTGVTRKYGEEIAAYLSSKGVDARAVSVGECDLDAPAGVDLLLLGCWTSGLFVIRQHPDGPWLSFVRAMSPATGPRLALFTTYKLATGSQFPKMRAALAGKTRTPELELKSRDGHLSDADRAALDRFVAG
jgi:flavodoxin